VSSSTLHPVGMQKGTNDSGKAAASIFSGEKKYHFWIGFEGSHTFGKKYQTIFIAESFNTAFTKVRNLMLF